MGIKINPNEIREISKNEDDIGFFVYGDLTDKRNSVKFMKIIQWMNYWGFRAKKSGSYTNILVPKSFDLSKCFYKRDAYNYVSGFSIKLDSFLNVEDFSNLILCKTFKTMGISKESAEMLYDEELKDVNKVQKDAIRAYKSYSKVFGYNIDNLHFSSNVHLDKKNQNKLLKNDEKGEKFLKLDKDKNIIIKNDESLEIYKQVAFSYLLNAKSVFIYNKSNFNLFSKTISKKNHVINAGSVTVIDKKGLKKDGNNFYFKNIISELNKITENQNLTYNIIAGQILSFDIVDKKEINLKDIFDLEKSIGLYLSHTSAKLKFDGIFYDVIKNFHSNDLQYKFLKSSWNYSPKIFLDALREHCDKISEIYENEDYNIQKDNNIRVFLGTLLEDLELGMKKLGLFSVEEVKI